MHIGQSSRNLLQDDHHPLRAQELFVQPVLHTSGIHLLDCHAHVVCRKALALNIRLQLSCCISIEKALLQHPVVICIQENLLVSHYVLVTFAHLASINPLLCIDICMVHVAELQHRLLVRSLLWRHHHPSPLAIPQPIACFQVVGAFQGIRTYRSFRGSFPEGAHGFHFLFVHFLGISFVVGRTKNKVPDLDHFALSFLAELRIATSCSSPEIFHCLLILFREVVPRTVERGNAEALQRLA
mmetsp:Transcript_21991/g.51581  ORF Transcript_21991/g.51581 Transcript_21991/m.51581 type:complete len:241 (-) Transcript_21991:157-879(-)